MGIRKLRRLQSLQEQAEVLRKEITKSSDQLETLQQDVTISQDTLAVSQGDSGEYSTYEQAEHSSSISVLGNDHAVTSGDCTFNSSLTDGHAAVERDRGDPTPPCSKAEISQELSVIDFPVGNANVCAAPSVSEPDEKLPSVANSCSRAEQRIGELEEQSRFKMHGDSAESSTHEQAVRSASHPREDREVSGAHGNKAKFSQELPVTQFPAGNASSRAEHRIAELQEQGKFKMEALLSVLKSREAEIVHVAEENARTKQCLQDVHKAETRALASVHELQAELHVQKAQAIGCGSRQKELEVKIAELQEQLVNQQRQNEELRQAQITDSKCWQRRVEEMTAQEFSKLAKLETEYVEKCRTFEELQQYLTAELAQAKEHGERVFAHAKELRETLLAERLTRDMIVANTTSAITCAASNVREQVSDGILAAEAEKHPSSSASAVTASPVELRERLADPAEEKLDRTAGVPVFQTLSSQDLEKSMRRFEKQPAEKQMWHTQPVSSAAGQWTGQVQPPTQPGRSASPIWQQRSVTSAVGHPHAVNASTALTGSSKTLLKSEHCGRMLSHVQSAPVVQRPRSTAVLTGSSDEFSPIMEHANRGLVRIPSVPVPERPVPGTASVPVPGLKGPCQTRAVSPVWPSRSMTVSVKSLTEANGSTAAGAPTSDKSTADRLLASAPVLPRSHAGAVMMQNVRIFSHMGGLGMKQTKIMPMTPVLHSRAVNIYSQAMLATNVRTAAHQLGGG